MDERELALELEKILKINEEIRFIQRVITLREFNDEPRFFNYGAKINFKNNEHSDFASSLNQNQIKALIMTYAEALERYAMSDYDINKLILKSEEEIKEEKLQLKDIINSKKIDKKKISKEKLYWDYAEKYPQKIKTLIPAQLIYIPLIEEKNLIRHTISTGAACSNSKEKAIESAILEVIERDNYITSYLNEEEPIKIPENLIEDKEMINYFKRYLLNPIILKLNKEKNIHTILTILEDKSKNELTPAISLGCSSNTNLQEAIEKSLQEAHKTRLWIRREIDNDTKKFKSIKNPNDIKTMLDKGFFWAKKENKKHLNFLIKTKKELKEKDIIQDKRPKLEILQEYLKKNKLDLYIKDLTPQSAEKNNIYIIKAIIPKLHPLYLSEKYKYDQGPRLKKNIKEKLPHPFL